MFDVPNVGTGRCNLPVIKSKIAVIIIEFALINVQ